MRSEYLFDVETESGREERRQLDEQHVPAPVVEGLGDDGGPNGNRGEDRLPRNWRSFFLKQARKKKHGMSEIVNKVLNSKDAPGGIRTHVKMIF